MEILLEKIFMKLKINYNINNKIALLIIQVELKVKTNLLKELNLKLFQIF
jgi:hypothetical protein